MTIARLVLFAARRRAAVLVAAAGLTLLLGAGLLRLRVETGVEEWLPVGHPDAEAFRELLEHLPAPANQELIWLELDPRKAEAAGVDSITSPEEVIALRDEVAATIAEEVPPGGAIEVGFLGYRTMPLLFTTSSWRWIRVTSLVSLGAVLVFGSIVLRRRRLVLALGLVSAGSTLWWLGGLWLTGIWLSVFLLLPLVFAVAIGSDYALHLLCRQRDLERRGRRHGADVLREVWGTTGRAVLVAAFTDAGVFLIYSRMELVSGAMVLRAVAVAVVAVLLCTLLVLPGIASPRPRRALTERAGGSGGAPPGERP